MDESRLIVIVCGGRDFKRSHRAAGWLLEQFLIGPSTVYHGAAYGADLFGRDVASVCGIPTRSFLPDWDKHGKPAGMIRNRQMLHTAIDEASLDNVICTAFPGGRGTANMVSICRKAGVEVIEYEG